MMQQMTAILNLYTFKNFRSVLVKVKVKYPGDSHIPVAVFISR
jgi:hypothetical protein